MKGNGVGSCLLVACLSGALFAAAAPVSIINNGGFESGTTGWSLSVNGNDSVSATRIIDSVSGDAHEGNKFHRITVTSVSSQNWHVQLMDPTWVAKVGYVYHFSMWGRADAAHNASISVYGNATDKTAYRTSTSIAFTTEWKQYHQMFVADAEGPGQINFAVVVGAETGIYDIDDVVITETQRQPGDLYINGGFEADGAGWNLWVNSGDAATGAATLTYPATGAHSGSKFGRVTVTAAPAEIYEVQLQDGTWGEAELDSIYTIKFWAKADAEAEIKVAADAGASRDYITLASETVTLTTEWAQYEFEYVSEIAGADSLNFNIYCGGAVGVYDFDDIALIKSSAVGVTASIKHNYPNKLVINVLPAQLQCVLGSAAQQPLNVTVHDIAGRLFSSTTIVTAGRSFGIPRPHEGTWIVGVNCERKVVIIP